MALSVGNVSRRNLVIGYSVSFAASIWFPIDVSASPKAWAEPVEVEGVPNLHRVSANFYRSAQPTAAGMRLIARKKHVRTVINLRHWHSDTAMAAGTGIRVVNVPMNTWHIETEDVVRALKLLRAGQARGPVLLHCQHGADRTGLITALYRIAYQGWSKEQALDEMLHGGFGYHAVWGNIPSYIKTADIAALKRAVRQ